jgi:hypothetical protein
MFNQKITFSRLLLLSLILCYVSPSQAQEAVYDGVPSPPVTGTSNEALPPVPTSSQSYTTTRVNGSAQEDTSPENYVESQSIYQNNQNSQLYLVYINSDNLETLEQVRQIEPGAYIRQVQGRSIIQVGVFSRAANAKQRVAELTSSGLNAGVVTLANGQPVPNNPGNPPPVSGKSKFYFVAIPANARELPGIQARIRQNIGQSAEVMVRNQPRGPHIAVGRFSERSQAEQWNNYFKTIGYGNARVYYGE